MDPVNPVNPVELEESADSARRRGNLKDMRFK